MASMSASLDTGEATEDATRTTAAVARSSAEEEGGEHGRGNIPAREIHRKSVNKYHKCCNIDQSVLRRK